jgi:hypothetical protein
MLRCLKRCGLLTPIALPLSLGSGYLCGTDDVRVRPMAHIAPSPTTLRFPEWQEKYKAALVETDCDKLPNCVAAAEAAIVSRLQVLVDEAEHGEERIAMTDALHALRFLRGSISL